MLLIQLEAAIISFRSYLISSGTVDSRKQCGRPVDSSEIIRKLYFKCRRYSVTMREKQSHRVLEIDYPTWFL